MLEVRLPLLEGRGARGGRERSVIASRFTAKQSPDININYNLYSLFPSEPPSFEPTRQSRSGGEGGCLSRSLFERERELRRGIKISSDTLISYLDHPLTPSLKMEGERIF
jgi:hypothetical protein